MRIRIALILAGGKGTRLLSVTKNKYPKPLVKIDSETTILRYTIDSLKRIKIKKIFIIVGHQKKLIMNHIKDKDIVFFDERGLFGTGGAIKNLIQEQKIKEPFLVTPSDHFLNWSKLKNILTYKRKDIKDNIAIWHTSSIAPVTEKNIINNIWYDYKSGYMFEYLSNKTPKTKRMLKKKYKLLNTNYQNTSSMGLVIINPQKYLKSIKNLRIKFPYSLYTDLAPLWIYENKHKENIIVRDTKIELIDVGTPQRLKLVRTKFT